MENNFAEVVIKLYNGDNEIEIQNFILVKMITTDI